MKRTSKINLILGCLLLLVSFNACKKDKNKGTIEGFVTDSNSAAALANVRIVVFDANTNEPTDIVVETNAQGKYSLDVLAGTYYLKLSKQGYQSVPPPAIAPLALEVVAKEKTTANYKMKASAVANAGWISGEVRAGNAPTAGVLVVASLGANAYSAVTDGDGRYFIYNVPVGSYTVKAWKSGFNSDQQNAAVTANSPVSNINLSLVTGAGGTVTGQISFLSTTNIEVDVALVHPLTQETIPGLSTMTVSKNYSITQVPDGVFIARASYKNDGKVVDPDWLIKNGQPLVTIAGNAQTVDFSVTGAVDLVSPTNISSTTQPIVVTSTTPTFSWNAYSSASDYVIEVLDANGNLIWGGFDLGGTLPAKLITIPSSQTSIIFNSNNQAVTGLESGSIYRWRVYASKNDNQAATGWKLISASEEQRGIIKVE